MSNITYDHEQYEKEAVSLIERSKCFEVVLSKGEPLKCDPDEVWRVIEAIKTGQPARLKQGFFNPSYYVSIIEDAKRNEKFADEVWQTIKSNKQALDYGNGQGLRRLPEFRSLKDIFKGISLKAPEKDPLLASGNNSTGGAPRI